MVGQINLSDINWFDETMFSLCFSVAAAAQASSNARQSHRKTSIDFKGAWTLINENFAKDNLHMSWLMLL